MNPRVQYFACVFFLIYLGKGVHAAEDNCWMKDATGTKIIYDYLGDIPALEDKHTDSKIIEFQIVNATSDLPKVHDVVKNAESKYLQIVKEKDNTYALKTTDEIARYVSEEDGEKLAIKIIYTCPPIVGKDNFEKSTALDVTVKSTHAENPKFLLPEDKKTLDIPLPLIAGVQVPGVEIDVQYASFNNLSMTFDPAGYFEVWKQERKAGRKYAISLKTMQVIDFPDELNVTLTAKDAKDASKSTARMFTLKVNAKESAPLLSGPSSINQRKCAAKESEIGSIDYLRGDPAAEPKFTLTVVPEAMKSHFALGAMKEKKLPIILQSCPELKETETNNVASLTVTAEVKGAKSDFTVAVIFADSPAPAPNDGGGHGGLTAALVIFILLSIGTTAGLVYFWRKVRNMSSSFP